MGEGKGRLRKEGRRGDRERMGEGRGHAGMKERRDRAASDEGKEETVQK
jgi:hypothetical protein